MEILLREICSKGYMSLSVTKLTGLTFRFLNFLAWIRDYGSISM